MLLAQYLFNKMGNIGAWNVPYSLKSVRKASGADVTATRCHLAVTQRATVAAELQWRGGGENLQLPAVPIRTRHRLYINLTTFYYKL